MKNCIAWKKAIPLHSVKGQKAQLVEQWDQVEALNPPVERIWTAPDESKLVKLKRGDFINYEYMDLHNRAFLNKCKFIYEQGKFLAT